MTKFISWNVNGIRAAVKKGFEEYFNNINADIFCIQETKLQPDQLEIAPEGYYQYWNYADKKGYSGTAVFTKIRPKSVYYGLDMKKHDKEGRLITLEFSKFYLVNVYTPNAKRGLERLDYRLKWEDDFRSYVNNLDSKKPVIICGDMNVAHREIDIKNPKRNVKHAGFTPQEREKFTMLLDSGFIDTYRHFHPDEKDAYTWWSYMFNSRDKNIGWRLDYFCISKQLTEHLKKAAIHSDVLGSDHCPIELVINM